jgi:hypothetical protein
MLPSQLLLNCKRRKTLESSADLTVPLYAEIAKIGFRGLNETAETEIFCQSSPLIVTFSSNYRYAMFKYVLVFTMVSL